MTSFHLHTLSRALLAAGPADAENITPVTPGMIAMYAITTIVGIALVWGVVKLFDWIEDKTRASFGVRATLIGLGVLLTVAGGYLGLVWAPPDRMMGDVQRIMYVHVPLLWNAMIALCINFACSVLYLLKPSWKTDSLAEVSAEIGLIMGANGVLLGSIWAKPTWGVWWTWDPRLIAAAIMLIVYAGYLALRRFIEDPDRRALWSSVVGILDAVALPLVWFAVRWFRSIHQFQSSPSTVDPALRVPLRVTAFAFLFLLMGFLWQRYRIALATRREEVALPDALPSDQPGLPPAAGPREVTP